MWNERSSTEDSKIFIQIMTFNVKYKAINWGVGGLSKMGPIPLMWDWFKENQVIRSSYFCTWLEMIELVVSDLRGVLSGVCLFFFFFKQKTAYEITVWLEFRRVLFRSGRKKGGVEWCVEVGRVAWALVECLLWPLVPATATAASAAHEGTRDRKSVV